MGKAYKTKMDMILRDKLALDRTHLANERTLLSYLRTGLYLIVFATAVFKLEILREMLWLGAICVILGVIVAIYGAIRYYRVSKRIERYYRNDEDSNAA
jgi:putative membrane protein